MRRVLLITAVLLASCAHTPSGTEESSVSSAPQRNLKIYRSSDGLYEVMYPTDWSVQEESIMNTQNYQITGTSFVYPAEKDHTTLFEAQFHVAHAATCPIMDTPAHVVLRNGQEWSRYEWSGVGAGNLYEGVTYMQEYKGQCFVLTTRLHSCNLGPDCGDNHTEAFDRDGILNMFDTVAQSFTFTK